MRAIFGADRVIGGTVKKNGKVIKITKPLDAMKNGIAYLPEDRKIDGIVGDLSVRENIILALQVLRGFFRPFSKAQANKFAEEYIKLLGIKTASADTPIKSLSGGNQQKVILARWLLTNPEYLILDEPVDGLDPVMRRQVWSLMMGDVAERGTTVLVSSHNLRELEDVCDHVGIMDHGHVLLERSLAQLQNNMVKLQVVFPDGMEDVPAELPVLHASKLGRVHTLIMRMNAQEATERLMAYSPLLVDAVPLTLEEIFIYELGGADYAVKDIVL